MKTIKLDLDGFDSKLFVSMGILFLSLLIGLNYNSYLLNRLSHYSSQFTFNDWFFFALYFITFPFLFFISLIFILSNIKITEVSNE